jgi:hypothetical protein
MFIATTLMHFMEIEQYNQAKLDAVCRYSLISPIGVRC